MVPLASATWIRPPVCSATRAPSGAGQVDHCVQAGMGDRHAADVLAFVLIEAKRLDLLIHVCGMNVERRLLRCRIAEEIAQRFHVGKTGNVECAAPFCRRRRSGLRPVLQILGRAGRI